MDVLGRQSPFEVFYCRESNGLTQMWEGRKTYKESSSSATNTNPKESDYSEHADQSRRIRSKVITSNNVWDKRYIPRKTKGDPPFYFQSWGNSIDCISIFPEKSGCSQKKIGFGGKIFKTKPSNWEIQDNFRIPQNPTAVHPMGVSGGHN